jgi:hypothetical protein
METLAFIASVVALLVSGVALYLASLRPGKIVVRAVHDFDDLQAAGTWDGARPPTQLAISIYLWNTGAQGAVLQGIGAFDLKPAGPWTVVVPGHMLEHRSVVPSSPSRWR